MTEPFQGKTHDEVLGLIHSKAKSETSKVEVRSINQTGSGRVLLELEEKSQSKAALCDTLKTILGDNTTVHKLERLRISWR